MSIARNEATMLVRNGPLLGPVLTRVIGMLAARAQCPIDHKKRRARSSSDDRARCRGIRGRYPEALLTLLSPRWPSHSPKRWP